MRCSLPATLAGLILARVQEGGGRTSFASLFDESSPRAVWIVVFLSLLELVRRGAVVEVDGVAFGAGAIERACEELRRLLVEHPDGITVAQIRDRLGTSRKFVLPLLAHLDGTGRTRRRGDLRIAGPRLG